MRRYERHGALASGGRAITDFIRIASNPVPEGGEAFAFSGADGGMLRGAIFPKAGARASVMVLSGRSEFIEKYFEVVRDLQSRGFAAASMDWRGQGLSERLLPVRDKGHIQDFGVFRSDLLRFIEVLKERNMPGPLILLTHSMGSLPALQMLADGDEHFCAAVLCSPMTRLFDSVIKRVGVRALAQAASRIGMSRRSIIGLKEHSLDFGDNLLTTDRDRHSRFRDLQAAAPNATIHEPTYGWLRAAMLAMDDLHKPARFGRMKTPTLILSAGRDHFIRISDHQRLTARAPLLENFVIRNALHEIMMERDAIRDEFWSLFDAFVEPRLAALMTQA